PGFILIAVLALPQLAAAWRYDPGAPENVAYYGVPARTKAEYAALYLGLAALLALMAYNVHEMLGHVHRGTLS
ncbi:MAG: site-2 protease family protein, partial [Methylobacteriaceae bacterium]|nr:site-2 protease family protein [Methylobacteriaceae bacterium]